MLDQNIGVPGSPSGGLGLGDQLQAEAESQILERRKAIMAMTTQAQSGSAYGMLGVGTGLNTGLGNMGFTASNLLNPGGLSNG